MTAGQIHSGRSTQTQHMPAHCAVIPKHAAPYPRSAHQVYDSSGQATSSGPSPRVKASQCFTKWVPGMFCLGALT